MELKDIIAIKGKGDLYRVIAKTPKGIVVESLNEKRIKFKVQPDLHVLLLSDITIFANDNSELYLKDVFLKIFEKDGLKTSVDPKDDPKKLRAYFKEIAPNHDEDRVYISDMKKMVKWYIIVCEWYPEVMENLKKEMEESKKAEEKKKSESEKKTVKSKKESIKKEEPKKDKASKKEKQKQSSDK